MSRFLGVRISQKTVRHDRRFRPIAREVLEDRNLMSSSPFSFLLPSPPAAVPPLSPRVVSNQLPKNVSGRTLALYELSLIQHPLYQSATDSYVLKAPGFYAPYTGPKRPDLDVVGATASINAGKQQIQFSGRVLGPIDTSQAANYSFLVNRGGAVYPGPIKGRPKIRFDAIVQISTGPGGVSGTVSLLSPQGGPNSSSTTFPLSQVRIRGAMVQAAVPLSLLPISAARSPRAGGDHYWYSFSTSIPGHSESDIAGFAPEYTMAIVDVPRPPRPLNRIAPRSAAISRT